MRTLWFLCWAFTVLLSFLVTFSFWCLVVLHWPPARTCQYLAEFYLGLLRLRHCSSLSFVLVPGPDTTLKFAIWPYLENRSISVAATGPVQTYSGSKILDCLVSECHLCRPAFPVGRRAFCWQRNHGGRCPSTFASSRSCSPCFWSKSTETRAWPGSLLTAFQCGGQCPSSSRFGSQISCCFCSGLAVAASCHASSLYLTHSETQEYTPPNHFEKPQTRHHLSISHYQSSSSSSSWISDQTSDHPSSRHFSPHQETAAPSNWPSASHSWSPSAKSPHNRSYSSPNSNLSEADLTLCFWSFVGVT